jgi:outer membrane receptor for Fe3+-dicitrate
VALPGPKMPVAFPIVGIIVGVGILSGCGEQKLITESERAARTQELQRQKTAVEQELRQLRARPEGTALSVVPRSEMENQPTRSQKESLQSVPGIAVRPGGNGRIQEFTIR